MIIPPDLKSGDKIRIVSPAGKINEPRVRNAEEWLHNQGFKVELGKHVFKEYFQFAGTDDQRLIDLQIALDDPDTAAIVCSRGGYGTIRIIDQLDFTQFKKSPKWLVGFSDITILHACINNLGVTSIHGAMPNSFDPHNKNDGIVTENLVSLIDLLTGEKASYKIKPEKLNKPGVALAELVGGNLSIICSLLGTKYELDTKGKILFLEDIDEYLYQTDRMMHQLKLAGKLENLAGLVVGDFTDMKDNESPFGLSIEEIILETVKEFDFPVCFGFPAGHDKKNLALLLGKVWELRVSKGRTTLNLI
jgi:muramoyltetrapeptide carboxypeptidase